MAGRRRTRHEHEREDGPAGGVATALRAGGSGNVHEHLQSLQRSYGNQAVTTMVQRKGGRRREKQASRDVPVKPTPKQADFFPKDHVSEGLAKRDLSWLEYVAPLERKNGSRGRAVKLYEEIVYRKRRDLDEVKRYAIALHLSYGAIDAERSLYWKEVAMGRIRPEETKTIAELIKEKAAAEIAAQGH